MLKSYNSLHDNIERPQQPLQPHLQTCHHICTRKRIKDSNVKYLLMYLFWNKTWKYIKIV